MKLDDKISVWLNKNEFENKKFNNIIFNNSGVILENNSN